MNSLTNHASPSYQLLYSIDKDIWNWYYGTNYTNNAKHFQDPEDIQTAAKIKGLKSLDDAEPILRPFLQKKIDNPNSELNTFIAVATKQFSEYFQKACNVMESITQKTLATKDFTFYITTFPRMVVFYDEGIVFTYAKIDNELWGMPLDGFMHELLHFQTDKYWRQDQNSPVSKLSEDGYFKLKESLTVILDDELKPIITLPDCSYPEFKDLRDKLHTFWKQTHDFNSLIDYGAKIIS